MKKLGALVVAVAMSGCVHYKYSFGSAKMGTAAPTMQHMGGLIEGAAVPAGTMCPGGIAAVETQMNIVDGLIAYISFRIAVPTEVTVTCVEGSQPAAPPAS